MLKGIGNSVVVMSVNYLTLHCYGNL